MKPITAVICTRNRGERVVCAVKSLLASVHPDFELLVVDQSASDDTAQALTPFRADPRLRYVRSKTTGLSAARNVGLEEARSEVVAFTDDDCEVPPDWLAEMARIFAEYPKVAVAFCNVDAAPHDRAAGFIPAFRREKSRLLTSIREKPGGLGAGFAVRRSAAQALGGFDEMLGAGAVFPSCEENDLAVRALLKGHHVYETDRVAVVHHGFRTWAEGRDLIQRDCLGSGAACAKPIKAGFGHMAIVPFRVLWAFALLLLKDMVALRRPRGLRRITAFLQGLWLGWRTPVDRETLLFRKP